MLECHLHKVIWRLILQCTSHFFFFIVLKTRFQLCFALLSSFHLRAWCTRPVYKGGRKSLTSAAVPTRCSMRVFFWGGSASPYDVLSFCSFFFLLAFFLSFVLLLCPFILFFFFHYVVFHRLCMFMCVCTCASAHLCAYYSFFFSKYYLTLTHSTPGRIRLCFLFFFSLCWISLIIQ